MTRARRAVAALRRVPLALVALLAVGAVLATTWALVLPPLQGPDESAHVAATTRLVEDGSLRGSSGLPRELLVLSDERGLGPLVGNLAARPDTTARAAARTQAALRALGDERAVPLERRGGPPTRGSARNPLYSAWTALPYTLTREAPLLDRLALMRLFGVPLLLVTIVACWALAAEVMPGSGLAPVVAGGVAALQPQLGFVSGVVNPDGLLVALVSLFCLVAARTLRRGLAWGRVGLLIVLALAASATHYRGAVLFPCAVVAIMLSVPWGELPPRELKRATRLSAVALVLVLGAAIAALVWGPWLTPYSGREASIREFASYVWQFYLPALPFMSAPLGGDYGIREVLETMWGAFGSLEVRYPSWVIDGVTAALVLAAAGVVAAALRRRPAVVAARRLALLLATLAVFTLGSLHVVAYRLLLVDPSDPIIVGRHLLVLIAPLSLAFALAVTTWGRRAGTIAAALLLGSLAALDIAALGLTTARFYG
jgi:hypothetical protein